MGSLVGSPLGAQEDVDSLLQEADAALNPAAKAPSAGPITGSKGRVDTSPTPSPAAAEQPQSSSGEQEFSLRPVEDADLGQVLLVDQTAHRQTALGRRAPQTWRIGIETWQSRGYSLTKDDDRYSVTRGHVVLGIRGDWQPMLQRLTNTWSWGLVLGAHALFDDPIVERRGVQNEDRAWTHYRLFTEAGLVAIKEWPFALQGLFLWGGAWDAVWQSGEGDADTVAATSVGDFLEFRLVRAWSRSDISIWAGLARRGVMIGADSALSRGNLLSLGISVGGHAPNARAF